MVKIIENYTLQQQIGEGEYGKVYRGIDSRTSKEVAVKVINAKKFKSNPKLQECTLNEIDVLTKIDSPYIVRFIQILKTVNNFYFFYEYCNGGTLQAEIKASEAGLPQKQVLIYLEQILNAFKILYSKNIMHRDLKPSNILLHNGMIKLGDFGFCKALENVRDLAQTMLGSPIYMAPEVLKGEIYTIKADIWSLGVVVYEMLFAVCPYEENSIARLISSLNTCEPQFIGKNISPLLEQLMRKMLIKDHFKRISWEEIFQYQLQNGTIDYKKASYHTMRNLSTPNIKNTPKSIKENINDGKEGLNTVVTIKGEETPKQGKSNFIDIANRNSNQCIDAPHRTNSLRQTPQKGYIKRQTPSKKGSFYQENHESYTPMHQLQSDKQTPTPLQEIENVQQMKKNKSMKEEVFTPLYIPQKKHRTKLDKLNCTINTSDQQIEKKQNWEGIFKKKMTQRQKYQLFQENKDENNTNVKIRNEQESMQMHQRLILMLKKIHQIIVQNKFPQITPLLAAQLYKIVLKQHYKLGIKSQFIRERAQLNESIKILLKDQTFTLKEYFALVQKKYPQQLTPNMKSKTTILDCLSILTLNDANTNDYSAYSREQLTQLYNKRLIQITH